MSWTPKNFGPPAKSRKFSSAAALGALLFHPRDARHPLYEEDVSRTRTRPIVTPVNPALPLWSETACLTSTSEARYKCGASQLLLFGAHPRIEPACGPGDGAAA